MDFFSVLYVCVCVGDAEFHRVISHVYSSTLNKRKMLATIIDTTLNEAPMTPATGLCLTNVGALPFSHLYSDISCKKKKREENINGNEMFLFRGLMNCKLLFKGVSTIYKKSM